MLESENNKQRRRRGPAEIVLIVTLGIAINVAIVANIEFGRHGGVLGSPGWLSYIVTALLLTLFVVVPTSLTASLTRKRKDEGGCETDNGSIPHADVGEASAEGGAEPSVPHSEPGLQDAEEAPVAPTLRLQPEAALGPCLEALLEGDGATDGATSCMVRITYGDDVAKQALLAQCAVPAANVSACFGFGDDSLVLIVAEPDPAKAQGAITPCLPNAATIVAVVPIA